MMKPYNSLRSEAEKKFLSGTPIDPSPRIRLEDGSRELTMRAMDLICPIGMGQRGLIVAPPGSGKTTFLKHICQAVARGTPRIKLYCLLIDERPEEVTDFKRTIPGEIHYSSIDQAQEHHIEIADQLMRRAFVEAAAGADVMIVIDSLTRLARVHNAQTRSSGRTISGGVDARALEVPRRIFGSARKIENGGSLSILATVLIETGSRMDQVIFEEFKGTGNMEIVLSREIANHRIFPAIDIAKSATRKQELLLGAGELPLVNSFRRALAGMGAVEAAQALVAKLQQFPTNQELLSGLG
ncbi:MAG: transcription termination factor Rho [Candidatus Omnitrophica bacterium]|nr:transcription termination factor Rho [Candidatus Omnitrophota bacterium]MDE2009232.1 transcription termination factor Rho [Candidatus Omnitrophota bacterium]MDE2213752.1 transcription termination factor Rho [Candidatus Omnitrophota bacterium]MDE2230672.1 transcription termination factor Rho [Candidatus Omnitrophota bacterium]